MRTRALGAAGWEVAITIARLKKQRFGSSSEKIDREIEQLELALEGLETARASADAITEPDGPDSGEAPSVDTVPEARFPPWRRGKPRIADDAPRESIVLDPGERCSDCGGVLRMVGDDVAEIRQGAKPSPMP